MKKIRTILLLGVISIIFCYVSYGTERYEYFATDSDGDNYYLDTQSITYTNNSNIIRYWEKVEISNAGRQSRITETKNKDMKYIYRKLAYIQSCVEVNFKNNQCRTVQSIYYSSQGKTLYTYDPHLGALEGWSYIPPNTIAESGRDAVKHIIQNKTYRQPLVTPQPQLPLNTPQQRESYRRLQEYNAWLQHQPDYPEFDKWFTRKLQESGVTATQVNAGLLEYIRQLDGDYDKVRELIANWYREFYMERYGGK